MFFGVSKVELGHNWRQNSEGKPKFESSATIINLRMGRTDLEIRGAIWEKIGLGVFPKSGWDMAFLVPVVR